MATFTITTAVNIDTLTSKAGNDTYNINGGYLTVDQHTRYGTNQNTSAAFGNTVLSSTLGGTIEFNSTKVRLIAYNTGSGVVPAYDTTISQGSASGILLGVYADLTSAPTAVAAAMPTSGFILIRQWNSISYAAGPLTGISATATEADRAGWLEIVGTETSTYTQTVNRLNRWLAYGDYFDFLGVTTTGTRTTGYQIPNNGGSMWVPGVEVSLTAPQAATYTWSGNIVTVTLTDHGFSVDDRVEIEFTSGSGTPFGEYKIVSIPTANTFTFALTGSGTGGNCNVTQYEFYPNAGTQTATVDKIATDYVRGRWCWIDTNGLVTFGYDGTNQTGGYCPVSGCKIRVANLFFQDCLTAARTVNCIPTTTLANRMEFVTTGGGYIEMDKVSMNWYANISQAFAVNITNTFFLDILSVQECASAVDWYNVGVGQTAAYSNYGFVFSTNFAGGTLNKCVFTRSVVSASNNYVQTSSYISGFTFTKCRWHQIYGTRGNASTGAMTIITSSNCTFNNCLRSGGKSLFTNSNTFTFNNNSYYDHPATTTVATNPCYVYEFTTCSNMTIDGLDFAGLVLCQAFSGVFTATAFSSGITCRNIGTYASPIDLGGDRVDDVNWSRVTTTATVTSVAHGLKTGDRIYVVVSSVTAAISVASKTLLSAPTDDTFTFTCTNSGATSGTLSYFPTMSGNLFVLGTAANNILVQRCYVPHTTTNLFTGDNSVKNVRIENVIGDYLNPFLTAILNLSIKSVSGSPTLAAQTSVYGTHRIDAYNADVTTNLTGLSWSRSGTICTVTCTDHKLRTGLLINVVTSDNIAAIKLGTYTVTVINSSTFTFTCVNSGSTSGSLDIRTVVDIIILLMNEATADTADQINLTGTAAFTSVGGLVLPTIGDTAIFESPSYRYGFTGFPAAPVVMSGATITNFWIEYQLDINDGNGYGSWHNMYYLRAGGSGTVGNYTFTITDATGVEVGDYVSGTNIGGLAKVTDVTSNTITVDTPNTGTVSGNIIFYAHQRNESLSGLGFKFRIRITSVNTYATAITALSIYADSDDTSRAKLYPLEIVTVKVIVKDINTGLPIQNARVYLETTPGGTTIFNDLTDINGEVKNTSYEYTGIEDVVGRVRKASAAPYYKTSPIVGEITSNGYETTVFLIPDS